MSADSNSNLKAGLKTGFAAMLANLIEQTLHPLDVIKIRFQSHDGLANKNLVPKYQGIFNAFKKILVEEGLRGLYRGVFFSFVSSNIAKSLFFGLFGMQKEKYNKIYGEKSEKAIFYASVEASVISTIITCPLWVIKTRLILNTDSSNSGFVNLKRVLSEIYQQHGLPGFFRGIQLSLVLSSHGIIQMTLYENFKLLSNYDSKTSVVLTPAAYGIASKSIASLILYPVNVIRTRIQQNQFIEEKNMKYSGVKDCVQKIYKLEGFTGFYKGFIPSTMRAIPSNAIFFFFFEYFKKMLSDF